MGLRRATRRFFRRLSEPPVGGVDFGELRRTAPVSRGFGFFRGQPVDRVYIERFLRKHQADIRGNVLEIADSRYTKLLGDDRVTSCCVLHPKEGNPRATLVGDLVSGENIPTNRFDCAIVTQTLQFIYDVPSAIRTLARSLAPGGVLLTTVPCISQISVKDQEQFGEYWRFTESSLRHLLDPVFSSDRVSVFSYGNVLSAISFLSGLAKEELTEEELDVFDPEYPLIIAARAIKAR